MEGDGGQSSHILNEGSCRVGEGRDSVLAVSWVVDLVWRGVPDQVDD